MEVVILDDERTSIALLQHYVRKFDCAAVRFTNPGDALQWCASNNPGLVIVDYNMPGMDGIEFTHRFRALPDKAAVPVMMVSASTDRLLKQHAFTCGVSLFLRKPIDQKQFSTFMESIVPPLSVFSSSQHHSDISVPPNTHVSR